MDDLSLLDSNVKYILEQLQELRSQANQQSFDKNQKDDYNRLKREYNDLSEKFHGGCKKAEQMKEQIFHDKKQIEKLEREIRFENYTDDPSEENTSREKEIEKFKVKLKLMKEKNEKLRQENDSLRRNLRVNEPNDQNRGFKSFNSDGAFSRKRKRSEESENWLNCESVGMRRPARLSEEQIKIEMADRQGRKKQVLVTDQNPAMKRSLEDIRKLVKKIAHIDLRWKLIDKVNEEKTLVSIELFEDKVNLIKARDLFREHRVYFKDNRTAREQEIMKWLKTLAKKEEEEGRSAFVGHLKIQINGTWKVWSEERAKLVVYKKKKY